MRFYMSKKTPVTGWTSDVINRSFTYYLKICVHPTIVEAANKDIT